MRADHLSREDFAQVGAVALIQCADSFDPSMGVPFGAYARRRIKGAFADEMRREDWASRGARSRMGELADVTELLTGALGRQPDVEELAAAMGVDRATVEASRVDAARIIMPLSDTIADMVAATSDTPEDAVVNSEREAFMRHAVAALPERMRYVVEQIYYKDRAVKDLALELGSSHSAVSQQRAEAMRLLRDGLEKHYLDAAEAGATAHSRISAARRSEYLTDVGERTRAGTARLFGAGV